MILSELIKGYDVDVRQGKLNIDIKGVESDSRKIKDGYLFVAIKGFERDGHECVQDALKNGAVAVLSQKEVDLPASIPLLLSNDTRLLEGKLSARVYNMPSEHLKVIGVTGTNGKGTITFLLKHIFEKTTGKKCSLIGTIENILIDEIYEAKNTTPSASTVQYLLKETISRGGKYMLMEASSHALSMGRLNGCRFDYAILTNITHDHLDYHKTMKDYIDAKKKLFKMLKPSGYAVINADLSVISEEFSSIIEQDRVITYGIRQGTVRAKGIDMSREGISFVLFVHDNPLGEINVPMVGNYNVYNVLAAICVGLKEGISFTRIKDALECFPGVDGRFEFIDTPMPFDVVVDFAHTPDALKKMIATARRLTQGRLIVVFGAGGESDKKKRPVMGNVVTSLADITVITNDNPKREVPLDIIRSIEEGAVGNNWLSIPDRRRAIEYALTIAKPKDMVIVAGKGHERTQIFNGYEVPFYDKDVILDILSQKKAKSS